MARFEVVEKGFDVEQTEEMLNELVENDKLTYSNILYGREFADQLQRDSGVTLPWFENKFNQLVRSYTERQTALKNSTAFKTKNWLDAKTSELMNWLGLGAVPIVPIAIGGVVGVVATVSLYFAFRPKYSESTKDLRISSELKSALDEVSPATQQKIKDNLEKQIDKAFQAGRNQGGISAVMNLIKWVAIAGVGIYIFLRFFPELKKTVDETTKRLNE